MPLHLPAARSTADRDAESPASEATAASDAPQPTLRIGSGTQNLSLAILATVAVVFALDWAQSLCISLLLGILFAYSLNPLIVWLERIRLPRFLGTTLVMLSVFGALVLGTYGLRGEMQTILDQLPEAVSKLSAGLASLRKGQASTMQMVETAASEIEKATAQAAGKRSSHKQAATRVVIDAPGFGLGNFLWVGSLGAAGLIAQAAMVFFLTFFLLLSGDTYKRKLVRLAGPSLTDRKLTVRILDDINTSIQRYMLMILVTNALVGVLTWIALYTGSASTTRAPGRWPQVCCTSFHTSGRRSRPQPLPWRPSYSSTACRRSCWPPVLRWQSPRSSAPSSPPG
jgi:predicted PurR-regulated permease PerM